MKHRHRFVIAAAAISLGLQGASSPLAATDARLNYGHCFVQEIHTPLPADFLGSALPKGFRPAEYEPSVPGTGDAVSTVVSCGGKDRASSELWVWTDVEPPKNLRSRGVTSYGWLHAVFTSDVAALRDRARSCALPRFVGTADFDVTRTAHPADGGETAQAVITPDAEEGRYHDEFWTDVGRPDRISGQRLRLFGGSKHHYRSFDVVLGRGSASEGVGVAAQRLGSPTAEGTSVGVPGTLPGRARNLEVSKVSLVADGPTACRR